MARRLSRRSEQPEQIVTSPALRAVATATVIADGLGLGAVHLIPRESLYDAGAATLLQVICGLDDRFSCVMLVGHNPGMTEVANLLAHASIENIPTCGVVVVRFSEQSWADIRAGSGEMIDFDFPKREP